LRELAGWFRTRVLQPRIALLWLAVLAAVVAAGAGGAIAWTALASAALIVQFRLWDDLEDVPHDRMHAPDRTLVRSTNRRPFHVLLWASILLLGLAIASMQGWTRAGAYVLLVAAVAVLYRAMGSSGPRRALRSQLVLAKYPAFVLLLAGDPTGPVALAAAGALYVVLGTYEWRDRKPESTP
jgi:4-hydroxybenzoate polyprenyltransferase